MALWKTISLISMQTKGHATASESNLCQGLCQMLTNPAHSGELMAAGVPCAQIEEATGDTRAYSCLACRGKRFHLNSAHGSLESCKYFNLASGCVRQGVQSHWHCDQKFFPARWRMTSVMPEASSLCSHADPPVLPCQVVCLWDSTRGPADLVWGGLGDTESRSITALVFSVLARSKTCRKIHGPPGEGPSALRKSTTCWHHIHQSCYKLWGDFRTWNTADCPARNTWKDRESLMS